MKITFNQNDSGMSWFDLEAETPIESAQLALFTLNVKNVPASIYTNFSKTKGVSTQVYFEVIQQTNRGVNSKRKLGK